MVKIYDKEFPQGDEDYKEHFDKFPFKLSDFQKHSIKTIVNGDHSLVVACTGSGKSIPFEFAVSYFVNQGKKVIYASPIKALSNQKYHDLREKFPDISFGILTGDIKNNPDASVMIMTAEIVHNQLQNDHIDPEVACVVFDEIHYINDADRGTIWEESILMLNPDIQLVMLSATIATPEKFASWIENRPLNTKEVCIAITNKREVPLTHYSFLTAGKLKKIEPTDKGKRVKKEIEDNINKLHVIKHANGKIDIPTIQNVKRIIRHFRDNKITVKRSFILDSICNIMNENNMLPAIIFVFSRKQVITLAKELNNSYNDKFNAAVQCESIIRHLPNYKEYLLLPEYHEIVALLEKGIAFHHGGMLSILREIVEIMFARGYVKILFATETFAAGINLPVKTAVFIQLDKYSDEGNRMLHPHEYTQMAGRAGRRGIDLVGNVIHLDNLFKGVNIADVKNVMSGIPQTLVSKFKISYNWLLNNYDNVDSITNTMFHGDINAKISVLLKDKINLENDINSIKPDEILILQNYEELLAKKDAASQKKKRYIDQAIKNLVSEHPFLIDINKKIKKLHELEYQIKNAEYYITDQINLITNLLIKEGFIVDNKLTSIGIMGCKFKKVHPLIFARLLSDKYFDALEPSEITAVLSCFTRGRREDEEVVPEKFNLPFIISISEKYEDYENKNKLSTGSDYNMQYTQIDNILEWCLCEDEQSCKLVLQNIDSVGDFIKTILEINAIAEELLKVADYIGNIALCDKLQKIPELILKYIATSQSLYI